MIEAKDVKVHPVKNWEWTFIPVSITFEWPLRSIHLGVDIRLRVHWMEYTIRFIWSEDPPEDLVYLKFKELIDTAWEEGEEFYVRVS